VQYVGGAGCWSSARACSGAVPGGSCAPEQTLEQVNLTGAVTAVVSKCPGGLLIMARFHFGPVV